MTEKLPWLVNNNLRDTKWATRFIDLAQHVAQWSKDPSTKVGAVIVDPERRVVSLGYNGFARGVDDSPERYADKPTKYKMVVHAEANAVLNARVSLSGCVLYATKYPCSECAKILIQTGIISVVCPPMGDVEPWATDAKFAATMFSEASVVVVEVP